jgi:hypothetical protein
MINHIRSNDDDRLLKSTVSIEFPNGIAFREFAINKDKYNTAIKVYFSDIIWGKSIESFDDPLIKNEINKKLLENIHAKIPQLKISNVILDYNISRN